jgi:thymidylate synthase
MQQYHDLLQDILRNGVVKGDRTKTGMIELFGPQMSFDLSAGFPLVTTKKMFLKGIIHELLYFLEGSTNVYNLPEETQKWWTPWANEDGEIGPMYGKQLRRIDVSSQKKIIEISKYDENDFDNSFGLKRHFSKIKIEPSEGDENIGKSFFGNYGHYTIIKRNDRRNRKCYDIQFDKTGFVAKSIRLDNIKKGSVKDRFCPSVFGVGFMGEEKIATEVDKKLYSTWQSILERCYKKSHPQYKKYGGDGVFVDSSWHNFSTFKKDVKKLCRWEEKYKNWESYELDKDYYGGKVYSKKTCIWLTKSENQMYSNSTRPFFIKKDRKILAEYLSRHECARDFDLQAGNIWSLLKGQDGRTQHKGYTFEWSRKDLSKTNNVYRYEIVLDQISNLINEIKVDKNSRRLAITTYNAQDLEHMALYPCHGLVTQFCVSDGKLDCHTYQRSADSFIGLPVNIASYSLLLIVISQLTDTTPGILTYSIGSAHIYANHVDQVKTQLERDHYPLPTMRLNPEIKNIDDFKYEDFSLEDYECHPTIKAPIAV